MKRWLAILMASFLIVGCAHDRRREPVALDHCTDWWPYVYYAPYDCWYGPSAWYGPPYFYEPYYAQRYSYIDPGRAAPAGASAARAARGQARRALPLPDREDRGGLQPPPLPRPRLDLP